MKDRELLLQEEYINTQHGPWKVLVTCQMLNKTAWVPVEKALRTILIKWSTPDKMAYMSLEEMQELHDILKPLGLVQSRVKSLLAMSIEYDDMYKAHGVRYNEYDISSLSGCGRYAIDAWTLFVLKKKCFPTDRRLKDYAKEHNLLEESMEG